MTLYSSVFLHFQCVCVCVFFSRQWTQQMNTAVHRGLKDWDYQCDMEGQISSRYMILNNLLRISTHFKLNPLVLKCDTYFFLFPVGFCKSQISKLTVRKEYRHFWQGKIGLKINFLQSDGELINKRLVVLKLKNDD